VIALRRANLILAVLAVLAPVAHVLELPNKLALDGPLWLSVQQHLYRGWGPLLGGPAEIGALASSVAVLALERRATGRWWVLVACLAYAGMLAVFFAFDAPVNAALSGWTPASLPADWPRYRLRWECGHVAAAALSLVGLAALIRARAGRPSRETISAR
jgi:hypothetical protein